VNFYSNSASYTCTFAKKPLLQVFWSHTDKSWFKQCNNWHSGSCIDFEWLFKKSRSLWKL